MQNIPESVKALFRRDNVRKNLRISFPDGQMPDITNDNIVSESMRFDESISTRDTFTFGLADGSTLSFETVGIGNMLGYRIEASLEIDASTLPAELQTVKADVPFPVYPFPLGSFIVTSCPRNHQAMAHRKVTAKSGLTVDAGMMSPNIYSIFYKDDDWSTPKQGLRLMMPISCDTAFRLMKHDPSEPDASYITAFTSADRNLNLERNTVLTYGGTYLYASSTMLRLYYNYTGGSVGTSTLANTADGALSRSMTRLKTNATLINADEAENRIRQLADDLIARHPTITLGIGGRILTRSEIIDGVRETFNKAGGRGLARHNVSPASGPGELSSVNQVDYEINSWSPIMTYKSIGAFNQLTLICMTVASVASSGAPARYFVDDATVMRGTIHDELQIYRKPLEDCTAFEAQRFDIHAHFIRRQSDGTAFFQWLDSDLLDRYMSAVEMSGGVVQYKHGGGQQIRFLSKDSPVRVTRDLYEKLWWDEYDIEPIGSVAYKWKDDELVYQFGEGRSAYQLTNNGLIDALPKKKAGGTMLGSGGGTSTATVEAILDAGLVPHLADSTYTPIELTAKGMPFLEPGDYIEVETDTGELVKSYILSRKLKGIQHLTDSITADGTTIVEVM